MTSHSLGAVIRSVGGAAQEAQKKAVFNAAFHMKNVIEAERDKDLKGKNYFSAMNKKLSRTGKPVGVRPANNRLTVRFDVKGVNNPTALLTARGPWGLLEHGASPHSMFSRETRTMSRKERRRSNANIAFGGVGAFAGTKPLGNMRTGFGPVFRVRRHPGTRPRRTFSRGVAMATPKSTQIATSLIQTNIIRHLRTQFGETIYLTGDEGSFSQVVG